MPHDVTPQTAELSHVDVDLIKRALLAALPQLIRPGVPSDAMEMVPATGKALELEFSRLNALQSGRSAT